MKVEKVLGHTDVTYKIICAGKDFDIGAGESIVVSMNGKQYKAKMHSKSKGRIDGLTALYNDNSLSVGDLLELEYNIFLNTIFIKKINEDYEKEQGDSIIQDVEAIDFETEIIKIQENVEELPKGTYVQFTDKEEKNSAIDALSKCEPVVFHSEYYNEIDKSRYMAVNNSVVLKYDYCNEAILLSDESGTKIASLTIDLKLKKNEYASLIGFNEYGIWFKIGNDKYAWNDLKIITRILCLDIKNDSIKAYDIEKKGYIRDIYIEKNNIAYVCEVTENKQVLYYMTDGYLLEIAVANKGISINHVSMNDEKISYQWYGREGQVWKIYEKNNMQTMDIVSPLDEKGYHMFDIYMVDLQRNVMYTSVTQNEERYFNLEKPTVDEKYTGYTVGCLKNIWATRKIANPKEFNILTYKKNNLPAVFYGMPDSRSMSFYFDFKNLYYPISYMTLVRGDKHYNEYYVGNTGHGEADKFIVSKNYVFVNYDAYDLVRIPRDFSTSDGYAKNNSEAMFFYGQGVDFRI